MTAPSPISGASDADARHPALVVASKHLATCGSVGFSGRRVGTRYAHTPRAVLGIMGGPWFRFRNDECAKICREAWAMPAPDAGEFFTVADPCDVPETGYSTRVDDDRLRKCSLVRWEREPYLAGSLHQLGDTEFYQVLEKRPDYFWYHVGRTLKLNAAGRAALAEKAGA